MFKFIVVNLLAFAWFCFKSESQDQIRLQWQSGKSAIMNILVVHAMIILLTYGKPEGKYLFIINYSFEDLLFLPQCNLLNMQSSPSLS